MKETQNKSLLKEIKLREDKTTNICLLTDNKGKVTSEYGFTYDILSAILASGDYSDYIKDGDWIELTTFDDGNYKMYANIDTYYGMGETGKEIGHHIDFISDNLICGSSGMRAGKDIYFVNPKKSYRMNYDKIHFVMGTNNGVSIETSPFLANTFEYMGRNEGIINKLNEYYTYKIPNNLKNHIVKKYHKVPTRYQSGFGLTDDNGSKWAEMPYLWIPYEKEIFGSNTKATSTYESHMKQYHSFANISNFKKKGDKKDTNSSWHWWTASAYSGDTSSFCIVGSDGSVILRGAYAWNVGAPLCFRFQ